MKKDITGREDIELLINTFYERVKADDVIGYIFNDVAKVNWETHLPIMYDFWENVVFFTGHYDGNPVATHRHLDQREKLLPEHFQRWNELFIQTTNELFEGLNAELIKNRARSISVVLQLKVRG